MALAPGIHTIPAADYHADKIAKVPSLSASVARKLLARSPMHAWWEHPRLNLDYRPKQSSTLDHGSAVHALLLEGKKPVICDFPDWRTNASKDARAAARKAGDVPLLRKDAEAVNRMLDAITVQLDAYTPRPFVRNLGQIEQTIVWTEPNGTVCRARVDYLLNDHTHLWDLKTTTTAHPRDWSRRRLWEDGLDIQCGFYRRGVKATTGVTPEWGYVVVENTPPYALTIVGLTPEALALADQKVNRAIDLWQECLSTDTWPGYADHVCYAELPPWEGARWLEQQALEEWAEEGALA